MVSSIISTRNIKKGDKVSYNCTFEAARNMRIGVIPFGYYEGLPVALSNSHPILGRVCMNHTILDLTDSNLQIGDEYTVYPAQTDHPHSFYNRAKQLAPIAYELPTKIAESIRREIVK